MDLMVTFLVDMSWVLPVANLIIVTYYSRVILTRKLHRVINCDCKLLYKISYRSGCCSVGGAVAFNTRGLRFDSSHRQNFIEHLFIINCIEKTKINKKRLGMAHFLKKKKKKISYRTTGTRNLRQDRTVLV